MKVELLLAKGIKVNDILIELGEDIRHISLPYKMENYGTHYSLFDATLQIETQHHKISEITCCIGVDATFETVLGGERIDNVEKDQLIRQLSDYFQEEPVYTEKGHSVTWNQAKAGCWSEITIEQAEEEMQDAHMDHTYEEMKEDLESDWRRSRYFDVITISK